MQALRKAWASSRSFAGSVVDIVVRPSAAVEGNELPKIVEIQAYMQRLDTLVLVYHHKREKWTAKFDHLYLVFKTSVDANTFHRMWQFWDDNHFIKGNYDLRRNSDFPSVVLYLLQNEVKSIPCVTSSKEPTRFKRFAFTRIGPVGSGSGSASLPYSASLNARLNFLKNTFVDQEIDLVDLEGMVRMAREERDKCIGESVELRAQLTCYRERWERGNNVDAQGSISNSRK
ncbi:unnamed protein product [Rhizoctonia solani]|nr:unnamed protein product [Rhizoctonia solani]